MQRSFNLAERTLRLSKRIIALCHALSRNQINSIRTYAFGVIPLKRGVQITQYSPGFPPMRE